MSADKIKFYVQGWAWDPVIIGTDWEEISFYSEKPRTAATPRYDLTKNIVEMGKLRFMMETIMKNSSNKNGIYYLCDNITVQFSDKIPIAGARDNGVLSDFFKINEDTTYVKYLVELVYDGVEIFRGTIEQDGLKEPKKVGDGSHIITALCVSVQKEMTDYYYEKSLKPAGEVAWPKLLNIPGTNADAVRCKKFGELLAQDVFTTGGIQFDLESDIQDWYVSADTTFYKRNNSTTAEAVIGTDGLINDIMLKATPAPQTSRTQFIWTASELIAAGLASNTALREIEFTKAPSSPSLNCNFRDLNVKMKHSSHTTLTGFDSGGFQVLYSANLSFNSSADRIKIVFSQQFIWDGISNIIVEVCFDYTDSPSSGTVFNNITAGSGSVWERNVNGGSGGCGLTGGSSSSARPQVTVTYTIQETALEFAMIKCGYERIQANGEHRLGWFVKTCNSMGWRWWFKGNTLFVRNRSTSELPVLQVPYNTFSGEGYEIIKLSPNVKFTECILLDGAFTGGDAGFFRVSEEGPGHTVNLRGERFHAVTKRAYNENSNHWSEVIIEDAGGGFVIYRLIINPNYTFSKYYSENDNTWTYINVLYGSNTGFPLTHKLINLSKDNILFIDGGHNSIHKFLIHLESRTLKLYQENVTDNSSSNNLIISGCYGNQMIKVSNQDITYTFEQHVKSQQWKNNYARYIKNINNISIKGELLTLLTNPHSIMQILNAPADEPLMSSDNEFYIESMDVDLIEETTDIEIYKKTDEN